MHGMHWKVQMVSLEEDQQKFIIAPHVRSYYLDSPGKLQMSDERYFKMSLELDAKTGKIFKVAMMLQQESPDTRVSQWFCLLL
jgi:hypothetical protein